jgi:competence protein ComEC
VVVPFLRHRRVRHLDYLVATHPQADHAKGFGAVFRDFRVGRYWDNGVPSPPEWYRALRQVAVQRGIYQDPVAAGYSSAIIDGVRLDLLHPRATYQPQAKRRHERQSAGENNRSLVLKLTYGTVSFLFTGDIEHEAERALLHSSDNLRATVLKVPHHGSRTSSSEAFVRAVNPGIAVFSVQRHSRFGHPHPVVVERYQASGAQVWRTDKHGAISVRSDGQKVWVEPYIGASVRLPVPLTQSVADVLAPAPTARTP